MPVVLGLGNPGPRYARTRHNVGWRVVERLVERWRAVPWREDPEWFRSWVAMRGDRPAFLVLPLGYMNRSGGALAEWLLWEPAGAGELLVVCDDVYLPIGTIRLRGGGSSGGHRGLESIEEILAHGNFHRLRIGVGQAESGAELREHVLEEFTEEETATVEPMLDEAVAAVECWFDDGLTAAMNRFNRRVRKEETTS